MNNLKKIGLTALGTALVTAGSAQAADQCLYQVLLQSSFNGEDNRTKVMVGQ